MPSVFDKTPGEIIDRICILDLKIRAALCNNKPRAPWMAEREALYSELIRHFGFVSRSPEAGYEAMCEDTRKKVFQVWTALAETVTRGWAIEDATRAGEPIMHRLAQALNDDRIGLVQGLNHCFAVEPANVDKV